MRLPCRDGGIDGIGIAVAIVDTVPGAGAAKCAFDDILVRFPRTEDFVEVIAEATDGRGVDVILDNMAAKYLGRNVSALATNGRLVVIGMQGGVKGELNLGALMSKRASITATSLRARPVEEKAEIVEDVKTHVWPLLEFGKIRPIVDRAVALQDAAEAHRLLEGGEATGKILLVR